MPTSKAPCWLQVCWVSRPEAQPKTKTSLENSTVLERTNPAYIPIQAATLQHRSHLAACPGEPPLNPLDPPNARLYRSGKRQIYLAACTRFCCQVLAAADCGVQAPSPISTLQCTVTLCSAYHGSLITSNAMTAQPSSRDLLSSRPILRLHDSHLLRVLT